MLIKREINTFKVLDKYKMELYPQFAVSREEFFQSDIWKFLSYYYRDPVVLVPLKMLSVNYEHDVLQFAAIDCTWYSREPWLN